MKLHDLINHVLLFILKKQRIKTKSPVVKVNLGSGLKVAEGWINVDGHLQFLLSKCHRRVLKMVYNVLQTQSRQHTQEEYCSILKNNTFIYHNIRYGIPFDDNAIDCLYTSHLLEHFFLSDAEVFIKEAYRVLKKDGLMRICVPDLEHAVELYRTGRKKEALEYFFLPAKVDHYRYHRYLYDFELLEELLERAGFRKISKMSYQKGKMPDIQVLDNRPEETLYVEATK
jgi:predicted SAM-dependent methyltransferase